MIHTVIFSDEITLWWDKEWDLDDDVYYKITLGSDTVVTKKTHVSFKELLPETAYAVTLARIEPAAVLFKETVTTPAAKRRLDVSAAPYGAVGDGVTDNTAALQRAINDCGKDDCVYFPKGTYLSGALDLHSDMEIYLDEGATLQGSQLPADYLPKRKSRFEGIEMECYASLLNMGEHDPAAGPNCRNIVIRGSGSILGGGLALAEGIMEEERARLATYLAENADYVKTCENENTIPGRARGRLIHISNCENVIIAGLFLGFAASWNVHFIYSKNILTYGCRIHSRGVWNGDGWDPDSAEDCTIFDTEFLTHDNSIAIKSGKNPGGNIIGRPTKNVRIFDCHGSNCMAIGSEMSGGIDGVYIWDCDVTETTQGLGIKVTPKRGGYVRNVRVRNCRFVNVRARSVTFNDDGEPAGTMSVVEDILFENVTLTGVAVHPNGVRKPTEALFLVGLDAPEGHFCRFTLDGIRLPYIGEVQKIHIQNVTDLTMKGISFFEE